MKRMTKYNYLLSALLLLGVLLSGCNIREDNTDCPRPFRLFIKAQDADGKDITSNGDVTQVILFIFNEKQEIVDVISVPESDFKGGKPINVELDYPGHQSLTFVAWANVGDKIEFPASSSVKQWNDLYAKLITSNGEAQSPGAVFYGNLNVPVEYGGLEPAGDQTVVMTHRTAQVTITALGLKRWNGNKEGKYEFRLRDSQVSIDKDGTFVDGPVHYAPAATMNSDGNMSAPIFNTLPPKDKYTLEILFDGEVIYSADSGDATITKAASGTAFVPQLGRVLNIIVDFRAELSVKVVITPWNVVYQYVEI